MTAFYNEIDPYAAQWLRNLIAAGHITPGVVDERPIQEIEPWELAGFTQCHFFAGIGIWSHALRRAGWPDDRPIWTGSCPCQPFSNAGKRKGISDDRHLWPHWFNLIKVCKPPIVIGEQVASKDGLGWFDLVSADMENAGYAIGTADLCAAGFDGAHIRQRLYFIAVADTFNDGQRQQWITMDRAQGEIEREMGQQRLRPNSPDGGTTRRMADTACGGQSWSGGRSIDQKQRASQCSMSSGLVDSSSPRLKVALFQSEHGHEAFGGREANEFGGACSSSRTYAPMLGRNAADWLFCRDGKWRPVEPGTFPLVDETPGRMGRLRAYGNGLDAETATQFCQVVKEIADGV